MVETKRPVTLDAVVCESANTEVTAMSTADYVKKENVAMIAERMQRILDAEAPIAYDWLVKKTLRSFEIARSSQQMLDMTDKAFKKVSALHCRNPDQWKRRHF